MPVNLRVRVTPRSGRDEVVRWDGEMLHLRVAAPPVGGEANNAVINLLSSFLKVPKSALKLKSGAAGRVKTVAIEGREQSDLLAALEARSSRASIG